MADNVSVTPGSGATVAAEDVGGGVLVQRVKTTFGPSGSATDVSSTNPMPVAVGDGGNASQGAKADAAATDSTSAWSVVALLKGMYARLAGTLSVTNPDARPFQGIAASTIGPFPAATTSANAAIALPAGGGQVRIANTGSSPVRIAWGTSNTAAATTPTPGTLASGSYAGGTAGSKLVAANGVELLSAPAGTTYVAFKTDSGNSTIEFTPGAGA